MKVARAKDMRLDTIPALREELGGYRRQLADSYLTDKEVTEVLKDMPNIKDMSEGAVKMKRVRCIETLRKLIFNLPK